MSITQVGPWSWTVPANTYAVQVQVAGGGGAGGGQDVFTYGGLGGSSALVTMTLYVTPGQVLSGIIGHGGTGGKPDGTNCTGGGVGGSGYSIGGAGGQPSCGSGSSGGGGAGGGSSTLTVSSTSTWIVSGGGGGGGGGSTGFQGTAGGSGNQNMNGSTPAYGINVSNCSSSNTTGLIGANASGDGGGGAGSGGGWGSAQPGGTAGKDNSYSATGANAGNSCYYINNGTLVPGSFSITNSGNFGYANSGEWAGNGFITLVEPPTTITLKTQFGSNRFSASDQLKVSVLNGATVLNSTTNSTTTGSGSTVTAGTGTTGTVTLPTDGATYTLSEVMASGSATTLAGYSATISCTNATPTSTTVLPSGTVQSVNITPAVGDAITCTFTNNAVAPTINYTKAMGSNRINNADQFTMQVKNGATVINSTTNSTSTGSGSTITAGKGTTGVTTLAAGTSYTISESMAAGSVSALNTYGNSTSCTNTVSGSVTTLPSGSGTSFTLTPVEGDIISCITTNTALNPTVTLNKVLGGNRANNADQFTMQIKNGATLINSTTNSTSAGTGSTITTGTATTGATTIVSGTSTTLTEVMASGSVATLNDYNSNISCTNSTSGSTTVLPSGTGKSFTLTPNFGDVISCTITNTPIAPTVTLTKALGGNRANAADQFTVQVLNGASVVNATTNSTTTGSGSTVTGGKGTTGVTALVSGTTYTLNDIMAAGSVATLTDYSGSISCSNSTAGSPTVLPNGSGSSFSLTPLAGDVISCTLTNTPIAPTLTLTKVLGGNRANNADQFTVQIVSGVTVINSTANSTTTGSGTVITPGSGTTGVTTLISGTTYTLSEQMASGSASALSGYTSSISCTNSTAGSTTILPNGTGQSVSITPFAADNISCQISNVSTSSAVSGKVIIDNGAGTGGIAHNGIQDGNESGHAGVTLSMTNCAGTTYGTTHTDSLGAFSFTTIGISSGNICIVKFLEPGYEAVSSNAGNSAGIYTTATDSFRFAFSSGKSYSNIVLGEVQLGSFSANGTQQMPSGAAVTYSHVYTAGTSATLSFNTSTVLTPTGLEWSTVLYLDAGCSGTLVSGDSVMNTSINVTAGQKLCILVKIISPAGAGNGAQNSTTTTITETLTPTPTGGALTHTLSNTDNSTVTPDQLTLTKQVRVLSTCPTNASASLANNAAYATSIQAQPGQTTQYLLTYSNNSVGPITQIKINDATPAYTSFQNAYCLTTPSSLAGCSVVTQPVTGGTGSIQFTLTDLTSGATGLAPGASGTVSFCVLVKP